MNNEMQRAAKTAATLRYGTTGVITALDMAWRQRHNIAKVSLSLGFMFAAVFCIRRFSDDRCMER